MTKEEKEAKMAEKKEARKNRWAKKPRAKYVHIAGVFLVIFACIWVGFAIFRHYINTGNGNLAEMNKMIDIGKAHAELSDEEIKELAPYDETKAAAIDAIPDNSGDDTWAIYLYMCGSNLESLKKRGINAYTINSTSTVAADLANERSEYESKEISELVETMDLNDVDFPDSMYKVYEVIPENPKVDLGTDTVDYGETGYASTNLFQITDVKLPKNVTFVIMTGGAFYWDYPDVNPNKSQIFEYSSNGFKEVDSSRVRNMGDPETLEYFLEFCNENYPADHTMLEFWDHGGAYKGACCDELFGDDSLSIADLKDAMSCIYEFNPDNPALDIVSFDACLMASKEVCETFYGYADYLFASEEVEPGEGWNYPVWVDELAKNPGMTPVKLGKIMTDSYIKQNLNGKSACLGVESAVTFSVTDLSYTQKLKEAYSALCDKVLEAAADSPVAISEMSIAADMAPKYCGSGYDSYNMVDLWSFMDNMPDEYATETKAVKNIIDEMVVYSRASSYLLESKGVSIYFPIRVEFYKALTNFLLFVNDVNDDDAVNALYYYKVAGCLNDKYKEYIESKGIGELCKLDTRQLFKDIESEAVNVYDDGTFSVNLPEETLDYTQDIQLAVYKMEDDNAIFYGEDGFIDVTDNTLTSTFKGKWLSINGVAFPAEIVAVDESNATYRCHIKYSNILQDKDAYLLVNYDINDKTYSFVGIQPTNVAEGADVLGRIQVAFSNGDKMTPIFDVSDTKYARPSTKEGKTVTYSENMKIEDAALPDGTYCMQFTIKDVRGNECLTDPVEFEMKSGSMKDAAISVNYRNIE